METWYSHRVPDSPVAHSAEITAVLSQVPDEQLLKVHEAVSECVERGSKYVIKTLKEMAACAVVAYCVNTDILDVYTKESLGRLRSLPFNVRPKWELVHALQFVHGDALAPALCRGLWEFDDEEAGMCLEMITEVLGAENYLLLRTVVSALVTDRLLTGRCVDESHLRFMFVLLRQFGRTTTDWQERVDVYALEDTAIGGGTVGAAALALLGTREAPGRLTAEHLLQYIHTTYPRLVWRSVLGVLEDFAMIEDPEVIQFMVGKVVGSEGEDELAEMLTTFVEYCEPDNLPLPFLATCYDTLRGNPNQTRALCCVLEGFEQHATIAGEGVLEVVAPRIESVLELLVMGDEDRECYLLDSSGEWKQSFLDRPETVRVAAARLIDVLAGVGLPVQMVAMAMQQWCTGDPTYQEAAVLLMGACMEGYEADPNWHAIMPQAVHLPMEGLKSSDMALACTSAWTFTRLAESGCAVDISRVMGFMFDKLVFSVPECHKKLFCPKVLLAMTSAIAVLLEIVGPEQHTSKIVSYLAGFVRSFKLQEEEDLSFLIGVIDLFTTATETMDPHSPPDSLNPDDAVFFYELWEMLVSRDDQSEELMGVVWEMTGSVLRLLACTGMLTDVIASNAVKRSVSALDGGTVEVELVLDGLSEVLDAVAVAKINLRGVDGGSAVTALSQIPVDIIHATPQSALALYGSLFAAGYGPECCEATNVVDAAVYHLTLPGPGPMPVRANAYWCLSKVMPAVDNFPEPVLEAVSEVIQNGDGSENANALALTFGVNYAQTRFGEAIVEGMLDYLAVLPLLTDAPEWLECVVGASKLIVAWPNAWPDGLQMHVSTVLADYNVPASVRGTTLLEDNPHIKAMLNALSGVVAGGENE